MSFLRALLETNDRLRYNLFLEIPLNQDFPTKDEFEWIGNFVDLTLDKTNGNFIGAGSGMGVRDIQYDYATKQDADKAEWLVKSAARKAKLKVNVRQSVYDPEAN